MLKIGSMTENYSLFMDNFDALTLMKKIGYEVADITLFETHNRSQLNPLFKGYDYLSNAKKLKAHSIKIGLPLVQAHAPFPVIVEDDDNYNREMHEKLVRCIEICGTMGIKNLVIHPWNNYSDEQNKKFFESLLSYAKVNNVVICCENMWNWRHHDTRCYPCACSLIDSFTNTINLVNDDHLKACVDVGHAAMFSHYDLSPYKLTKALNKNVACFHIHDNDLINDCHWICYKGKIDYKDFAKAINEINYEGDLISETVIPNNIDTITKAIKYWKKEYKGIKKFQKLVLKNRK